MKKIISTVLTTACITSFAQVENPVEYTKKIIEVESADHVDQYIALNKAAADMADFQKLIEECGGFDKYKEIIEKTLAQKPAYDPDTLWVTDDFEEAVKKTEYLKAVFGGKKLKPGYKIVMFGDKATSAFLLYQKQDNNWLLKDYPPMGKGLFVEE